MKRRAWILLLVQLVSVAGGLCLITVPLSGGLGGMHSIFNYLFDIVSLAFLFVFALPPMLVHGIWKDFLRVFQFGKSKMTFNICEIKKTLLAIELLQKQIIYGTIMITCLYVMFVMMNFDDMSGIGPNIAVSVGLLVYMAIALLFIEPLKAYTQRYLEDYLAEEED